MWAVLSGLASFFDHLRSVFHIYNAIFIFLEYCQMAPLIFFKVRCSDRVFLLTVIVFLIPNESYVFFLRPYETDEVLGPIFVPSLVSCFLFPIVTSKRQCLRWDSNLCLYRSSEHEVNTKPQDHGALARINIGPTCTDIREVPSIFVLHHL